MSNDILNRLQEWCYIVGCSQQIEPFVFQTLSERTVSSVRLTEAIFVNLTS